MSQYTDKISVEIFPPKKDVDFSGIFSVIDELSLLNPEFISVTYGAGGSQAGKTLETASYIQNEKHLPAIAHLTCVGNTKADIDKVLFDLEKAGINRILALRGDRPATMTDEQFNSMEFAHANELVSHIKNHNSNFKVYGACYPEKHFESATFEEDLLNLRQKIYAGCDELISQLFMDNSVFYRFLDRAPLAGINVPVHAGVMPVTSAKQIGTIISLSGTSIPKNFSDIVARYSDNPEDLKKAGIDFAIKQVRDLLDNGVDGVHLYSMNKPEVTKAIVEACL